MTHITPLHGRTRVPTRIIFFDTETRDTKIDNTTVRMDLYLGYAIYARWYGDRLKVVSEQKFRDKTVFWDYVCKIASTQKDIHMIAHNALFDMCVVDGLVELPKRGYELKTWYDKGMVCIYRFQCYTSKITIIDSTNFFQMKLEKIGRYLGIEKLDINFDTATDSELETYNIRDVEILLALWDNLYKFWFELDCGKIGNTVGSSALACFRSRFLHRTIITTRKQHIRNRERMSYHGGRVFVGFQGTMNTNNYYKLDYNSLYPSVMLNNRFPTMYRFTMYEPTKERVRIYLTQYCCIAYVSLRTFDNPFVVNDGERNIYPTGEFSVWLSTPELLYALDTDCVLAVHIIHLYDAHDIFSSYVQTLYNLRRQYVKDGNTAFEMMVKHLLTNLYGKFAQYDIEQEVTGFDLPDVISRDKVYSTFSGKHEIEYTLCGKRWINHQGDDASLSFTPIAAHVTALGRIKWWKGFLVAGDLNCYYGDTDSYIVNENGKENLHDFINDEIIGYLKIEDTSNHIEINAPKDYVFGDKIKNKGIPESAEILERSIYRYEKFVRWKEGLIRYNSVQPHRVVVEKQLNREIYDGHVTEDGHVLPIDLHLPLGSLPHHRHHRHQVKE